MDRRVVRRGPPVGRHVAAVAVILGLGLIFRWVHQDPESEPFPPYAWNVVWADVSVILLCLTLMLGPVARIVPRVRRLVPWNRELGIAMFVTAGLHLLILLDGGWDILGFFFRDDFPTFPVELSERLMTDWWAAANWVGLLALVYALVLAATSNDWSQRLLGRGWKFLQRQTYTLFVLVWLHAAGWFLLPVWFWVLTALAVIAQFVGFVHTIRATRGPSPQRTPRKSRSANSTAAVVGAGKWVAVAVVWGGLILGSLSLGLSSVDEMALFCERYEEVQDLTRAEMLPELFEVLPENDPIVPIPELIEECQDR